MTQIDEVHQILLDALHENSDLIRGLGKEIDSTNQEVLKLKYYVYTLGAIVLVLIGKPEWLAILL